MFCARKCDSLDFKLKVIKDAEKHRGLKKELCKVHHTLELNVLKNNKVRDQLKYTDTAVIRLEGVAKNVTKSS